MASEKTGDFDETERLARRSRLTALEAQKFASEVEISTGKHAEALLHDKTHSIR